jgi:hypothetical protein
MNNLDVHIVNMIRLHTEHVFSILVLLKINYA